jgi:hypothetical protein
MLRNPGRLAVVFLFLLNLIFFFTGVFVMQALGKSITIPIGCLVLPSCFSGGGAGGYEALASAVQVNTTDIKNRTLNGSEIASSNAGQFGVNEWDISKEVELYLKVVTDELSRLPRDLLLQRGAKPIGQRILSPIPTKTVEALKSYSQGVDFLNCVVIFEAMRRTSESDKEIDIKVQFQWYLYKKYITSCLRGPLETLKEAEKRIVIFVRGNKHRYHSYCLGYNFAENLVITARHCLVDPQEIELQTEKIGSQNPNINIPISGPLPQTRAVVLGKSNSLFRLQLRSCPKCPSELFFNPSKLENDIAVLELISDEIIVKSRVIKLAKASEWDRIVFPAIFIEDSDLNSAIDSGQVDYFARSIHNGSATDISPLCMISFPTKSKAPFLFHACQTRFGYSGAPILRYDKDGELELIGVHNGSVNQKTPVGGWPYTALFPNYGLRLPDSIVKFRSKN